MVYRYQMIYCVSKGARPLKVSMNNISGSYAVVPSQTVRGSQVAHIQCIKQTLVGELRCADTALQQLDILWAVKPMVKQCMAGKQLTGRLPLAFPLLYHILFYYLLLLVSFHSTCNDTGECNVWKIGGSDSLKT